MRKSNYPGKGLKALPVVMASAGLAAILFPSHSAAQTLFASVPSAYNVYDFPGGTQDTFYTFPSSLSNEPWGLAFDQAGDLFVANNLGGFITKFADNGGTLSTTGVTFSAGMDATALAFDSAGDLFEADGASKIREFKVSGGSLSTTSSSFATVNGSDPMSLAFDSAGDLFVADYGTNKVSEYKSTGGVLSTSASTFGTGTNHLSGPVSMAFDSQGDLFVASNSNNGIYEYSPSGVQTLFSNTDVSGPAGLAFDSAGDLFEANQGTTNGQATINEFVMQENGTLSATPIVYASGLNFPDSLAFQPAPVPEPDVIASLFGGLGMLVGWRRVRHRG
ncbi:MAG TPA: NHL repeat-containing protein [Chthoniobacter sp.]